MLWFAVWTVLVVGTLVGAFLLARDLWRKGIALLDEFGRAAEIFDALAVSAGALADAAGETAPIRAHAFDDRGPLRDRVDELRSERAARARRRADRHAATFARWRTYTR